MAKTYRRWSVLGVSAAALGGAGLVACGSEPETQAAQAETPAGTSAPAEIANAIEDNTPVISAPPVLPNLDDGEGGEGEGGEGGGEGGEGGVDVASARTDPAVYGAALAITEAHVLAARDAYALGESQAAAEMFAHPVSEVLFDMQPVFAERGVAPFDGALLAASRAAMEGEDAVSLAQRTAAIVEALEAAARRAPDDGSRSALVSARIAADQIQRAAEQYVTASRSEFYEPYLDGYGFYKAAAAIHGRHAEAIAQDTPEADAAIRDALEVLAVAYPTALRPETMDADIGALFVASSNVTLALDE